MACEKGSRFFEWQNGSPTAEGACVRKLQTWHRELSHRQTKGLLVVKNDRIIWEWYAPGHHAEQPHYTASLAKSLVGGMSLALAMDDGLISPEQRAADYIPAWREHPEKSQITVEHLATHTSGIADAHQDGVDHNEEEGWMGAFWRGRDPKTGPNPFAVSLYDAPLLFAPGTSFAYSNPGMAVLAYVATASLRGTAHPNLRLLLQERVMRPIGANDNAWSIGYGHTFPLDDLPLVPNWGGGAYTARATASVGRLIMRRGNWDGTQLLSPETVARMVTYHGTALPPDQAVSRWLTPVLGWYSNVHRCWPRVPADAFCGHGAGNQFLMVIPSMSLIVVRNGGVLASDMSSWQALEEFIANPLMEAFGHTTG